MQYLQVSKKGSGAFAIDMKIVFYLIKWCGGKTEWHNADDLPREILFPYYGMEIICSMKSK